MGNQQTTEPSASAPPSEGPETETEAKTETEIEAETETEIIWTMDDIRAYNRRKDALIVIIHDKVYDLTQFKNEHPGGSEVLEKAHLQDATETFVEIGHTPGAHEMMSEYLLASFKR